MASYLFLNIAQAMFLGLWSALWISIAGAVSIFHRDWPLVLARRCWAPGLIWASLVQVRLEDGAKLDPKQSYVFVMNHQSMFDIAVAFAVIPINLRFVGKSILKFVPFIGFFMWRTGMIFVDRKKPTQAYESLDEAARRIRAGASIIAYPEGTRSADGLIKPFKRGPFVAAQKAGVPIVPVAMDGSWKILPRGGFKLRPGLVRVRIGTPIPTDTTSDSEVTQLMAEVRGALVKLHRSIGGLGVGAEPEIVSPPPPHADLRVDAGAAP